MLLVLNDKEIEPGRGGAGGLDQSIQASNDNNSRNVNILPSNGNADKYIVINVCQ